MSTPKLTPGEPDAKKTPLSDNFQHFNRTIVSAYARCRRVEKIILAELESPSHADATRAPLDAQLALARDNFRCIVSGFLSFSAIDCNKELLQEFLDRALYMSIPNCCYIIKEDMNLDGPKPEHARHAWAILKSFGYAQISEDLAGSKIHSLKNVLTMVSYVDGLFNTLKLWLEATDEPNRYKVCTSFPYIFVVKNSVPRFVKFESTSPELELPSPEYLGLHAVCCRVAHMSGAAKYLDTLDDLAMLEDDS
ncbi:hypothetical protein BD779DRAFT_1679050 [Infundibulicybe gibba]|nr:hypothetical protein BD779DRAFT_1679050 [Infundibulicybe gibba]